VWRSELEERFMSRPARHRVESRYTRVHGLKMHARVALGAGPDAPAVVLVHGLSVSSRYMVPLARELARDFRVFAPDLPGTGLSATPCAEPDVPALARALAAWMEKSRIERAALVGNSLGCQVIAELGVTRPDLVARAVLQGPTTDPGARRAIWQLLRWMACGALEPPSLFPIVFRDYLDSGFRARRMSVAAMLRDRIEEKLPRLRMPVLIVRGLWDPIVPQAWAMAAARLAPRGRLVVVPRSAHAVNFSKARELARLVRAFVLEGRELLRGHEACAASAVRPRER